MFANSLFWPLIANAVILLSTSLASAAASANSVDIFFLRATNSTVKGHYLRATGKSTNGSTEATAVFTQSISHADHFFVDNQGQLHLLFFYNSGPGGLYVGVTDENKDNPGDQGLGTLHFATDLGYPIQCPIVSGPHGQISKFNCKLNSVYDGYTNSSFSWVNSFNKAKGVTDLVISATSQALFHNYSIVGLEAKIVGTRPT